MAGFLTSEGSSVNYFEPARFKVLLWEDRETIRDLIVSKHYLSKWPTVAQYLFGIVKDEKHLVGAIVFGWPNVYKLSKSISPDLQDHEICELLRLWVEDGHGNNIESWAITQAFKMLPKTIKVVYSLADPEQGHLGIIYQATNAWFQELSKGKPSCFLYNFTDPNDRLGWKHFRWVKRHLGGQNEMGVKLAHLKRYWKKPVTDKYRYLWFLCNKLEQKKIKLRHPITKNYPKQLRECQQVQEVISSSTA
jgi:hypothetical protein